MLTARLLTCSPAVTPDLHDGTRDNATALIRVRSEFGSPATCFCRRSREQCWRFWADPAGRLA
jgi:hypothetical protein